MHDNDIASDPDLVRALIAQQMPELSGMRVAPVPSVGTDNAMYRVGDRLAARLPRRPSACVLLEKEARILPRLGTLPLQVPVPRGIGAPSPAFPYPFSIVDWIEGTTAHMIRLHDPITPARQLAAFLASLRSLDSRDVPRAGPANHNRGVGLIRLDDQTRRCVAALADEIDAGAAFEIWAHALNAEPHPQDSPVWLHGDLKADNLLVRDGELVAVLDWGLAAVGDPAVDLACAWTWLPDTAEAAFRAACAHPDAAWVRARGWTLYGAVIALEYYRETSDRPCRNPALCAVSRATLARLGLR